MAKNRENAKQNHNGGYGAKNVSGYGAEKNTKNSTQNANQSAGKNTLKNSGHNESNSTDCK